MVKRTDRLNSLLREVIADVIRKDVRNPDVSELVSVMRVDVSRDLRHAKVHVSVLGDDKERALCIKALQSAAGFIAISASKQVVMRHFPALTFKLDTGVDQHMRIESLLTEINTRGDYQANGKMDRDEEGSQT